MAWHGTVVRETQKNTEVAGSRTHRGSGVDKRQEQERWGTKKRRKKVEINFF